MRPSKLLATIAAATAMIAIGVAGVPRQANAYVVYTTRVVRVWAPAPVVVVRPPVVYYAPAPVYGRAAARVGAGALRRPVFRARPLGLTRPRVGLNSVPKRGDGFGDP